MRVLKERMGRDIRQAIEHYWAVIKIANETQPRKYIRLHRKLGDTFSRVLAPAEMLDYPPVGPPSQAFIDRIEKLYVRVQQPPLLRVFLCHSSDDKPAIRKLFHQLRANSFEVWLDEEKILPGQDWDREIRHAVNTSDVVIVCLSKGSITKRGYIQKEIKQALDVADEHPDGTIFLIPARFEECDVPERLMKWQWVNLFDEDGFVRHLHALMARAQTI